MSDIKWVKLYTGFPDNKKIKRIRKLPDGDKVILFWVFLLARAGESNKKGGLFFTDTIPYNEEDFAVDFDFTPDVVRFSIITLEKYKMIEKYDDIIFIKNWEKYQQKDRLEKIQEQNRIRQAKYREKQQKLANSNVTLTSPVTENNAGELEQELEQDIKSSSNQDSIVSDFEKLWKLYPNKQGKAKALTAYKKAVKNGVQNKKIQDGIVAYKKHLANNTWRKPAMGSTWFFQERWDDEFGDDPIPDPDGGEPLSLDRYFNDLEDF